MKNQDKSKSQAERLVEARIAAGFEDAASAAEACGWKYHTYIQHERGERGLRPDVAAKYAHRYKVKAAWLLVGEGERDDPTQGLSALLDAVEGAFEMLGCDRDEAAALLKLVLEVAQEQPTPSAGPDFHRVLSEREARKFLQSKRIQHDGA